MKIYKRWNYILLGLLFFSMTLISTTNYVVDPYNIFKTPAFEGFNLKKIESKEYLMKTREVALYKPDVIFLGSSRTAVGLDPEYYLKVTGEKAYNLGLSGAGIYEEMRYLEYAQLNNTSMKRVIIGIDFEGFNKFRNNNQTFRDDRLNSAHFIKDDLGMLLLTTQSVKDSLKVLSDNIRGRRNYTINPFLTDGSRNEQELILKHEQLLKQGKNRFYEHLKEHLDDKEVYNQYELSQQKIEYFRKIVSICNENDIELTVLIHPAHALQWEGIKKAGLWDEFEEWKRVIVGITPVWDFSGYNSVTTSPPDNFINYVDQSHYRKKIGNHVLNRMLHVNEESIPGDFGIFLTEDNVEEHLRQIRNAREDWAKENPKIIQRLKEL